MKRESMQSIMKCAEKYRDNLLNTNVLIISTRDKDVFSVEIDFPKNAFLHLTGVYVDKERIRANQFYDKCINRKLSPNDFEFKNDGTTRLKLEVLPRLLDIKSSINMINTYNNSRPKLYTEKLAGNIRACLGLIKLENNYYVPNTVLKTDMRDEGISNERVVLIMRKDKKDNLYKEVIYLAKGIHIESLNISKDIKLKIQKL